jgi:hypothetical protein
MHVRAHAAHMQLAWCPKRLNEWCWRGCVGAQNEEMQVVRNRVTQWPKARLQEEGYAVFDLSMQPEGFLFKYVSQSSVVRALGSLI